MQENTIDRNTISGIGVRKKIHLKKKIDKSENKLGMKLNFMFFFSELRRKLYLLILLSEKDSAIIRQGRRRPEMWSCAQQGQVKLVVLLQAKRICIEKASIQSNLVGCRQRAHSFSHAVLTVSFQSQAFLIFWLLNGSTLGPKQESRVFYITFLSHIRARSLLQITFFVKNDFVCVFDKEFFEEFLIV